MDLNAIMSNIYGEGAPQNFDSLGLSGGRITRKQANIRYLDEDENQNNNDNNNVTHEEFNNSYLASKIWDLTGGVRIKHSDAAIISSAEYVNDDDCQTFIKEFYLHYLVTNPHKNMLLVIPSSATLKKMVSDFKDRLKKENIEPYTPEASRFAAKNDLPFKNYVFDVYGKDTNDNAGFVYQVPRDYPDKAVADVIRRTNRSSQHYFFKFGGGGKITVSDSDKFTKSTDIKFVAKCDRDVHVVKGDLPAVSAAKSKVISASLGGGARNRRILAKEFMRSIQQNHDIDNAAYNFIARVSRASSPAAVAKYYSGDFIHCAFSIIADNKLDVDESTNPKLDDLEHSKIINEYKPVKSVVKIDKVKQVLPKIRKYAEQTNTPEQANSMFINSLKKMYSTVNSPNWMFKADVATSIVKNNETQEGVETAINTIDEIDEAEKIDKGEIKSNSSLSGGVRIGKKVSTPFINHVYSALSSSPFIGSIAREYTPLLLNPIKPKSAFEDAAKINFDNDESDGKTQTGNSDDKNEPTNQTNDNKSNESNDKNEVEDELTNEAFDIKAFF